MKIMAGNHLTCGYKTIIAMALLVSAVSASIADTTIYSQTFDTNTSAFCATYGFSQSGLNVTNFTASNGQGIWAAGGSYSMLLWTAIPTNFVYNWSGTLMVSADLGSANTGGGQSYGILLGAGTGTPGSSGLSFNLYWPSSANGGWVSYANAGGTRRTVNANPDVTAGTNTWNISLAIRENTGDTSKFDIKPQINGTNQWGGDGWSNGLSKATYGINNSNPFGTIGFRADGLSYTQRFDNLTLVQGPPVIPLTAIFDASPMRGTEPLSVVFTDSSTTGTSSIVSRRWDFGNGNLDTTDVVVTNVYSAAGVYTVSLTVSNADGYVSSSTTMLAVNSVNSRVIYYEPFNTDTTNLLTTYGFSQNGWASGNYRVTGKRALWDGSGSYSIWLWHTIGGGFTYDWSRPLNISATMASANTGGAQSYGIMLATGTGTPGAAGLSFNLYWPSSANGGFVANATAGSRVNFNANPDVTAGPVCIMSMTIRQNSTDSSKFDVRAEINGVDQFGGDGWTTGLSKATYGINGASPFGTIGIRGDGLGGTQVLDELMLLEIRNPSGVVFVFR